ncbi:IMPACT family member [[Candida] railenensis]|uniref:IMPACT family member n=1 Tax=[Candida] railenensis TaxID=45579 RepID=A0A9P0QLM0_9ASCO|nr:IMPACT family member [[Candida] railenensis]
MRASFLRLNSFSPSAILTHGKSRFQGRFKKIASEDEIPAILNDLVMTNKAVSRASHPHIIAWRIHEDGNSSIVQGFKDHGEKGAGMRLLDHVLVKNDLRNVLVIVTRWYGGSPIGSSRFRYINNSALESLRLGGLIRGNKR